MRVALFAALAFVAVFGITLLTTGPISSASSANPGAVAAPAKPAMTHADDAEQKKKLEVQKAARAEQAKEDEIWIEAKQALSTVQSGLKDPDSARFRNVWAVKMPLTTGEVATLFCGEVNARNAFGGYIGFQPFIALGHAAYTAESSTVFDGMYQQYCVTAERVMLVE